MRAYRVLLMSAMLLSGCYYQVRQIDSTATAVEPSFAHASLRYHNGPATLTFEIKDARYDMRSVRPESTVATLTSEHGERYDLRFDPAQVRYDGSSRDMHPEKADIFVSFDFTVFAHGEQIQPVAELAAGKYTLSVQLSQIGRVSATFVLRNYWHEFKKIEG